MSLRSWIFAAALVLLPSLQRHVHAHGLDCNQPPLGFEHGGVTHDFVVQDESGSGVTWSTCDASANITGAGGNVACLGSSTLPLLPIKTNMLSTSFDLGCLGTVSLQFILNMQRSSAQAALVLQSSEDGGKSWQEVAVWDEDAGTPFAAPGLLQTVDLSELSSPQGVSTILLRWRYVDPLPMNSSWYVQIDDVALTCLPSTRADIQVQLLGTRGPVTEGAIEQYELFAINLGPDAATNFSLNTFAPGGAEFRKIFSDSGTLSTQSSSLTVDIPSLGLGQQVRVVFEAILTGAQSDVQPMSEVFLFSGVQSATCDARLNNNSNVFNVQVLRDADRDGIPNLDDQCPDDPLRSEPGRRGCAAILRGDAKKMLKLLDRMRARVNLMQAGASFSTQSAKLKKLNLKFEALASDPDRRLLTFNSAARFTRAAKRVRREIVPLLSGQRAFISRTTTAIDRARKLLILG